MAKYKYNSKVPVHKVAGWHENKAGLLEFGEKEVKGLKVFGEAGGILTEDKLDDDIVDFLMSKTDDHGNKLYEQYFEKAEKK